MQGQTDQAARSITKLDLAKGSMTSTDMTKRSNYGQCFEFVQSSLNNTELQVHPFVFVTSFATLNDVNQFFEV